MYTHTSRGVAVALIADRIGDAALAHWTAPEIVIALEDALRLWNLATCHERAEGVVRLQPGVAFYELATTLLDAGGVLLRPRTVTDSDLAAGLRYLLAETAATDQFATAQLRSALQLARDGLVAETGAIVTAAVLPVDAATAGVVDLPEQTIAVRRAAWHGSDGRITALSAADVVSAAAFHRNASARGTPRTFLTSSTPQLQLQLSPAPSQSGTLELHTLAAGAAFDPTGATATLLGIPDDLSPLVKFRATALVMRDSESFDERRAAVMDEMWRLGLEIAKAAEVVFSVAIDGVRRVPAAIAQTDRAAKLWQSARPGRPRILSIVGPDMIAVTPVPDDRPHAAALTVNRATSLPQTDNDYLQIGSEHLSAVLGMAQWLLMFKGSAADQSDQHFRMFIDDAILYTARQRATSPSFEALRRYSARAAAAAPYAVQFAAATDAADVRSEHEARRTTSVGGGQ